MDMTKLPDLPVDYLFDLLPLPDSTPIGSLPIAKYPYFIYSELYKKILSANIERIESFIKDTIDIQQNEENTQSISADPLIFECIRNMNKLGLLTIDSGQGVCSKSFLNSIFNSETHSFDDLEHPAYYEVLKRGYITGFLPLSLLHRFMLRLYDYPFLKYYVNKISSRDTSEDVRDVILDKEMIILNYGLEHEEDIHGLKSSLSSNGTFPYRHALVNLGNVKRLFKQYFKQAEYYAIHIVMNHLCSDDNGHLLFETVSRVMTEITSINLLLSTSTSTKSR